MPRQQIYDMPFGKVYDCLIAKAERKGRTRDEVNELTMWLTGYDEDDIADAYADEITYGVFFRKTPKLNPNVELIKGSICGVKIEEIEDPLMKQIRYLDKQVVQDLLDTLKANQDRCVGMAANMIGVKKNIIVVAVGPFMFAMINAKITKKKGAFKTEEGCLSLDGVRPCTRYKEIEVDYLDQNFKPQHGKYTDWTAQIIQHELDHVDGIVI